MAHSDTGDRKDFHALDVYDYGSYKYFFTESDSIDRVVMQIRQLNLENAFDSFQNSPNDSPDYVRWFLSDYTRRVKNNPERNQIQLMKLVEVYSLLENVFRNDLLIPYIPAYRLINKSCSRYMENFDEMMTSFLPKIGFREINPNQVIYVECDKAKTTCLALLCTFLWHETKRALEQFEINETAV